MSPSRRTLLLLVLAYALGGVAVALFPGPSESERASSFMLGVATAVAIYVWCRQESVERRSVPPGRSALWAAIFPPVCLPVYFFRTRRSSKALVLSLKAFAMYLGLVLVAMLSTVLALVAAQLLGFGRGA
jgi:hypothetical protein